MTRHGRLLLPYLLTLFALAFACQTRGQDIYYYTASWCGPCQQMHAVTDKLAAEKLIRVVDVDREAALARAGRVTSVPTFVAYQNKAEVARIEGARSEAELRAWIAKYQTATPANKPATPSPVCIVDCRSKVPNELYVGSGIVIQDNGQTAIVLTCAHTFREGTPPYRVKFVGQKTYQADLIANDPEHDFAALRISSPGVNVFPVDPMDFQGELSAGGYGSDGSWRAVKGPLLSTIFTNPAWRELRGEVRQGDSGGPVFNARQEVCGVLWGTGQGVTVFGTGQPLRNFLDRIGVVIPKAAGSAGSAGGNPNQPQPTLELPDPPIERPTPQIPDTTIDQELQQIRDQLNGLTTIAGDQKDINDTTRDILLHLTNQFTQVENRLTVIQQNITQLQPASGTPTAPASPVFYDIRPRSK